MKSVDYSSNILDAIGVSTTLHPIIKFINMREGACLISGKTGFAGDSGWATG